MATSKKSSRKNSPLASRNAKNKPNNKVLLIAIMAVVTVIGVLVVRYGGASSPAWGVQNPSVVRNGGTVGTKEDGRKYWDGAAGNKITLRHPSTIKSGYSLHCVQGAYLQSGTKVKLAAEVAYADPVTGRVTASESKTATGGKDGFTLCANYPTATLSLVVESGKARFYRFYLAR